MVFYELFLPTDELTENEDEMTKNAVAKKR